MQVILNEFTASFERTASCEVKESAISALDISNVHEVTAETKR